jgi:hypothetical protein
MHGETMEKQGVIGKREAWFGVPSSAAYRQWNNLLTTDEHG